MSSRQDKDRYFILTKGSALYVSQSFSNACRLQLCMPIVCKTIITQARPQSQLYNCLTWGNLNGTKSGQEHSMINVALICWQKHIRATLMLKTKFTTLENQCQLKMWSNKAPDHEQTMSTWFQQKHSMAQNPKTAVSANSQNSEHFDFNQSREKFKEQWTISYAIGKDLRKWSRIFAGRQ